MLKEACELAREPLSCHRELDLEVYEQYSVLWPVDQNRKGLLLAQSPWHSAGVNSDHA